MDWFDRKYDEWVERQHCPWDYEATHEEQVEIPDYKDKVLIKVKVDDRDYEVELLREKERDSDFTIWQKNQMEEAQLHLKYGDVKDLLTSKIYDTDSNLADHVINCLDLPSDEELLKAFIEGTHWETIEVAGRGDPPEYD